MAEEKQFRDSVEITATKELKLFVRSMAATYQFVFRQDQVDFVIRAMMIDLVNKEGVAALASRFGAAFPGEKLELSKEEVYLFYAMLELVCRSFLTEAGDAYKEMAMRVNQVSTERFNSVRSMELTIAQTLIGKFSDDFRDDPEFDELSERIALLDT
ncbi:MAG: hypothetical protein LW707_06605 [Sphingobacteriales bacterium]|jgi:hypothetical protein|nr:hypothetical protein [Sphingobacteriales bacterium]